MNEMAFLPLDAKKELCLSILAEIGARKVRVNETTHEIHCCCVMPWHPDNSPSAALNYDKLAFNCFSCQSGGGIMWLLATTVGNSSPNFDPGLWIETKAGVGGADFDLTNVISYLDNLEKAMKEKPESRTLTRYSEKVLEPWGMICPLLTTGYPDLGLEGRGIPEENLKAARVGWDTEAHRAIIPNFWRGELVGWQSRRLASDGTPKYLNTVDFPRDITIYRLDDADKKKPLLVVESPMSVIRHLHHQNMAATFGAKITDRQILELRWWPEVILWFDNDEAGWKATESLGERLSPYTNVSVVDSDWAADPADLDDEQVETLVSDRIPYSIWTPPTRLRCLRCRQLHGGECV